MTTSSGIIAAFSRHSLIRMIQRGGCHDVAGLTTALRSAWFRIARTSQMIDRGLIPNGDYLVPIRLPGLDEPRVALLSPVEEKQKEIPLVKTILTLDMLTVQQRAAVMMVDLLLADVRSANDFISTKTTHWSEIVPAIERCRQ